jgi:hypothetical protein
MQQSPTGRTVHFEPTPTTVSPRYESWEHYLASTTPTERRAMCRTRTKKANAPRLMSDAPERRLTADDVWQIVEAARGRCFYCGSLCLEKLPYDPETMKKLPWGHIGRRIGSLNHITRRVSGGTNDLRTCLGVACGATPGSASGQQEPPTTEGSRRQPLNLRTAPLLGR